jgi:lipopolysaccharide transport system ATP-binding protein
MKENIAITASHVSKRYKIGTQKDGSLRGTLTGVIGSKSVKSQEEFWALNNVSFEIKKGEVIGIVGKNGAGKSTLLKILSQITKPTSGRIEINGRVASLLEVGTGFHPELTGRENIYLNGTILGMSRKEVKAKFDEIVEFSGVQKFIDTPVKHYSSGMYVRLAFAVAAHLEPEILIIDEVLAVGDAEFQEKCLGKMKDVSSQGRTVLFVSHNMAAVQSLCTTGIFLQNGELKAHGPIEKIINSYLASKSDVSNTFISTKELPEHQELSFKSIRITDGQNEPSSEFTSDEEIFVSFEFNVNNFQKKYNIFAIIKDKYGVPVFSAERIIDCDKLTLKIDRSFLTRGNYSLQTFIHIPTVFQLEALDDICHFTVTDISSPFAIHGDYNYGNVFGNCSWIEGNLIK